MSEQNPIFAALAEPFEAAEVKWKPATVSGNRALALAFVDARVVQDRLDEVLGVENWQDEYSVLADDTVMCKLSVRVGGEWISKTDVGGDVGQSNDPGDKRKASFSDALKRAAVKFGVGRYLYRFHAQWVDYDPQKKQFVQTPKLPDFAQPKPKADSPPPAKKADKGPSTPPPTKNAPPANGLELQRRLYDYDAKLAKAGLCEQGELVKHVVEMGVRAGWDPDMATWTGPAMLLAAEETKAFEAQRRDPKAMEQDAKHTQMLRTAAKDGTRGLALVWKSIPEPARRRVKREYEECKKTAEDIDTVNAAQPA